MLSIVRTRCGIPISDIFFSPDPSRSESPGWISFFIQANSPADGFYPFKTHIIDLRPESGAIFSGISHGARYKIRRAEREGIAAEFNAHPTNSDVAEFSSFFDQFAQQKHLARSNRKKLIALRARDSLILSSAKDSLGRVLARHAYVADQSCARLRLLYSASHFRGSTDSEERNMIGRANRFLHWFEMQEAKRSGYERYDLGGIPMDERDPVKNAIARFKRELGGSELVEYNGFQSDTPIVRHILPLVRRIRR